MLHLMDCLWMIIFVCLPDTTQQLDPMILNQPESLLPRKCKTDVLDDQSAEIWKNGSTGQYYIWSIPGPKNLTNDMKLELNITEINCNNRKLMINEQPFCGNETGVYIFHSTCSGICGTIDRCVKLKKFPLSIKFNTKNKNHRFRLSYQFTPCIDDSKTATTQRFDSTPNHSLPLTEAETTTQMSSTSERPNENMTTTSRFLHDQGISDSCFGAVRQNKSDTIGKRGVGDKKWSIEPPNNESVKIHLKKIDCKGAALKIDGKKFCKRGTGYYTYRHESCGNSSCIGIGRDNCTATYFPLCIEYKGSETDSFRLSYEFKPCLENGNQISETTQRFDTTTQHQSPPLAEAGTTTQMTSTSERPKDTMTTTSKSPQNCKTDVLYNQSAKIWKTGSSEQCNIWELQRPENMTNDMKLELNITEIQCLRKKFIINEQPFCGNETGVYTFHSTCSGICGTIDRCVKLEKFPLSIKFNTKNKNYRFRLSYQFKPCIDDSKMATTQRFDSTPNHSLPLAEAETTTQVTSTSERPNENMTTTSESQARQSCNRKQLRKEMSEIRKYGSTEQCTWELHRPENFGNDVKLELNIKESNCRGERLKINEKPFCDNGTGVYTFHSTCGELCDKVDRCQKLEQFPLIITFKTNKAKNGFLISYQFKPCSDDSKTATNNTALVIVIPIFVITLLIAFVIIGILLKMRAKSSGNSNNRSNSMELKATNDQQATRQPGNTFRKLPEIPGTESPYEIVGDETDLQNNGRNNDAYNQLDLTKNVIQNGEGSFNNNDQQVYNDEENVLVDNVLYGPTQDFTPNDRDA